MGNSKVVFGNETLIDLTGDTVTTDTLLAGTTAHNRSGNQIVGTATVPDTLDDLTDVDITSAAEGDLLQYDATGQKWGNSAKIPQKVAGLQKTGCINTLETTMINHVVSGITFTVSKDGISSVGTNASSQYDVGELVGNYVPPVNGTYKLLGCPSGGSAITYWLEIIDDTIGVNLGSDTGNGFIVTLDATHSYRVRIKIGKSLPAPSGMWKPMVTGDLSATYDDYQPYSMTNRELTEEVIDLSQRGRFDGFSGAGFHNSLYRGKALGGAVSAEQWAQISAGTFDDLFIGDYWTIGGVNYRIAAFDYWLHCGDTECTTHHVVLVPDTNLYTAKMNDTNITTGGYTGSKMYTDNLASAKTTINTAFGSAHILSHKELLVNAAASGSASGWAWFASTVELMSESMVYGHHTWAANTSASGLGYETGIDKGQLPLFALEPSRICNRAVWWLRDVVSSTGVACVDNNGDAAYNGASTSRGVRPVFGIVG